MIQDCFQLESAICGGVLGECSRARRSGDSRQLGIAQFERGNRIGGGLGDDDLLTRREKFIEAFPKIADDRNAAGRSFKEPARWTPPHLGHG